MSQPAEKHIKFSPDDILPPVEPPNLAFIRQLVLIPLLIVTIIVVGWLFFSWLASGSADPDKMLQEIGRYKESSWQSASNLAQMLSRPDAQYQQLRQDPVFAKKLGDLLGQEREKPFDSRKKDDKRLLLCYFLCRALGSMETEAALPPLLEAAISERTPLDVDVRLGALEGIALLSSQLGPEAMRQNEKALEALLDCSRATDEIGSASDEPSSNYRPHGEIRGAAAFALGVIGGERANERLALMLDDPYASARYNAATGLARQGDARTIPVLLEMLDPENDLATQDEQYKDDQENRRITVLRNGMEAAVQLSQKAKGADLEPIQKALQTIVDKGCPKVLSAGARSGLQLQAAESIKRLGK